MLEAANPAEPGAAILTLATLERQAIESALVRFRGNREQTAGALGISTRTLQRRLKRWGVEVVEVAGAVVEIQPNDAR